MSPPACVHVLLPVHNRCAVTEKFVRCLLAQTHTDWRLVLVDDGSKDGTEAMVRALVPNASVLKGKGNWWWGGSLHQAYKWLRRQRLPGDDIIMTINDDTLIEPNFLANGVAALKPRSLLLAQQYDLSGKFLEVGVHWDWRTLSARAVPDAAELNCLSTRGLFVHLSDFLEIGGFHPILLPHYLSDYEFTLRARKMGFALITAPNVRLRHDESLTGIHGLGGESIWRDLIRPFSIRSSSNPVYWTNFVLLACPPRYVAVNLWRVWISVLQPVTRPIRQKLRPQLGRIKRYVKRLLRAVPGHNRIDNDL